VYAAVFIDAIMVKVRDGQVANRPIYAAIGVSLAGEKDVLGLWAGTGGEGAKFWMAVLTDLRNRGVNDVFLLVCDGLKGLPEVFSNVWPLTTLVRSTLRDRHLVRARRQGQRALLRQEAGGRAAPDPEPVGLRLPHEHPLHAQAEPAPPGRSR
jgi:transposase-like protein